MAKKITGYIKLQCPAGKATPSPPVGPALGQHGVNIMMFVKEFNERTASQAGMVIPAEITVFEDRTFTFITKTPPASFLLKKAAGLKSGATTPGTGAPAGKVKKSQIREIAEVKMKDLNANDIDMAMRTIEGSARAMGLEVVEG